MWLWRAVPTSDKFIVQLSAAVIRQAGPVQNVYVAKSAFYEGGESFLANISERRGIAHQLLLLSEN